MPAKDRPAAKFGPIPPDLDLKRLVEETPNFRWVDRISCSAIDEQGVDAFEKTVNYHVLGKGLPLVVDGWHNKLESWTFSSQWLKDNQGTKFEQARNLTKQENLPLSISHYLDNLGILTDQWTHFNYKEPNRQRLYLKDIDCPDLWTEKLKEQIPACVFYLNESTGEVGGPGSVDEKNPNGIGMRKSRGAAHSGDLMSCLPPAMRAENLMCYIGHEGTYTPAHREMCASLGQNIMVETSGNLDEHGKRTKPGSSIWFMTETNDRHTVSEYWLSTLGHDIEVEKHFAHINAWRKAPFTVYVVEQKVGDLILIPPLAPHQVWNRGTRTMKVAWNRTTVDTLELAMEEALPRARLVCRDEQYKNKSIVLFTLNRYFAMLNSVEKMKRDAKTDAAKIELIKSTKLKQLRRDFKRLFRLFNAIVISESFSVELPNEKKVEYLPYDSNVTCSYCRGNIFNRFLTCRTCVVPLADGSEDTYDICLECYAMGRSCKCISKLEWVEQFPWRDLLEKHELWRKMYIELDGGPKETSPQPFQTERKFLRTRTLAEVCQLELRKRPFKDPRKPEPESEPESDPNDADVTANGQLKKTKKKKRSEKWLAEHLPCHFCCYRHAKWKEAICTACGHAYCYGTLWRGFDLLPMQILQDKNWDCPKCRKICTCRNCIKDPTNQPFEPSGTILGQNTREFADPRSIESLLDFSVSNRHWIKKSGDGDEPEDSRRLQRRRIAATQEKEKEIPDEDEVEDEVVDDDLDGDGDLDSNEQAAPTTDTPDSRPGTSDDDIPIDPALTGGQADWSQIASKFAAQSQASKALDAMGGLAQSDPEAFEALGGLSQLERDPEAFMASAGIARDEDSLFVAPTAPMGESAQDDPSAPQPTSTAKGKGKKSRKSGPPKVVSDAPAPEPDPFTQTVAPSAANQRFQLQAERKRMGEAKKAKGLIAARAAMRGLTANVTLRLTSTKLAQFPAGSSRNANPEVAPEGDVIEDIVPIVESNLPRTVSAQEAKARNPKLPKKRVREEDLDEDFAAVPSRDRRTAKQRGEVRRTAIEDHNIQEISDDDVASDYSGGDIDAPTTAAQNFLSSGVTAANKRRSLPGYLARKEADLDAPLPKELAAGPRNRGNRTHAAQSSSPGSQLQVPPVENAAIAQRREDDRQAKLRAAEGLSDSASESDANDENGVESSPAQPAQKKQKTAAVTFTPSRGGSVARGGIRGGSIMSRGGRGGKIKISSAKK